MSGVEHYETVHGDVHKTFCNVPEETVEEVVDLLVGIRTLLRLVLLRMEGEA